MNLEAYDLLPGSSGFAFEFISVGPKGRIEKIVTYTEMETPGFFNLGFGDKDPITKRMDDLSRSGNGDTEKVLASVVQTLLQFTSLNPNAIVHAKGSTKARNRLYQMGISKYLDDVMKNFKVYGFSTSGWEVFKKGIPYEAFMAHRLSFTTPT